MQLRKQLTNFVVELYRTDFENGIEKIDAFVKDHPIVMEDIDLRKVILPLHAESYSRQGDLREALRLYLLIWKDSAASTPGFLPTGLAVILLYLKIEDQENARLIAEKMLKEIELQGYDKCDLVACLFLARVGFPDHPEYPTVQSFLNYLNQQLGLNLQVTDSYDELEHLENKLRNEGRNLTRILATGDSMGKTAFIHELEDFLQYAVVPTFRREAANTLRHLQNNN